MEEKAVSFNHATAAGQLNKLHEKFLMSFKTSINYAIAIGAMLDEVKGTLTHGEFIPWIEKNLMFSVRTAQDYMKISRNQPAITQSGATTMTQALALLKPETPPETPTKQSDVAIKAYIMDEVEEDEEPEEPKPLKPPKKIDAAFWYWQDILGTAQHLESAYEKLKKRRDANTPVNLGKMIGNLRAMAETLNTWDPANLRNCDRCKGSGRLENDTAVCPNCINGKTGVAKETRY